MTGTPLTGELNAGGVGKTRDFRPVSVSTACCQHGAAGPGPWQVATLIAGSKRRSLLMVGGDDEMFMTRNLNVTP